MDSQITFSKVLSAVCEVLKLAINFIPTALSILEVLKLLPTVAVVPIYLFTQIKWYWLLTIFLCFRFFVAALSLQLIFKTNKEKRYLIDGLHDLRDEGIDLQNEGMGISSVKHRNKLVKLEKDYEAWSDRVCEALNDYPEHARFLKKLGRAYPVFDAPNIVNIHAERLSKLDKVIDKLTDQIKN